MGVHITPMQALLRSSDSPVEARRTCRSAGRWYMVGRKKDGVALPSSSATKRESAGGAFSFRDGSWLVQQPLGKYVGSGKSIRVSSSPGLDVDVDRVQRGGRLGGSLGCGGRYPPFAVAWG